MLDRVTPSSAIRTAGLIGLVLLAAYTGALGADPETCRQRAREVAEAFGGALQKGDAGALRSQLPGRGKVVLRLELMGPEEGYYSPGQVSAILRDFLDEGKVRSFEVGRVESAEDCRALVHGRLGLTTRDGRSVDVGLRLRVQPEGDRWVVREIRETGR